MSVSDLVKTAVGVPLFIAVCYWDAIVNDSWAKPDEQAKASS